ncbi:MAG: hypothetical protein AW07_03073 [Candidatus Accumulibacter sp. SK-11]|nr:MAG: hypothetical protein AW07_03073 [Candidatus Accumulibacter sp. SK-11]
MSAPCVIWRVIDGKRGHERQTQGLVQALGRLMPVAVRNIPALSEAQTFRSLVTGRFPAADGPPPAIIVGAGHGTHLTMIAAQRARGGKTVVLMNPGLPRRYFDLCLVPRHDGVAEAPNVLLTVGALNAMELSAELNRKTGLILLGGLSPHYHWRTRVVVAQVRDIVGRCRDVRWSLTTSPRTPGATVDLLREWAAHDLEFVAFDEAPLNWLPSRLRRAGQVWVTPDSVSMLYEALTSGAAVGLLDLDAAGTGRVVRGVEELHRQGTIVRYAEWRAGRPLHRPAAQFNEAARCAGWIRERWFPDL